MLPYQFSFVIQFVFKYVGHISLNIFYCINVFNVWNGYIYRYVPSTWLFWHSFIKINLMGIYIPDSLTFQFGPLGVELSILLDRLTFTIQINHCNAAIHSLTSSLIDAAILSTARECSSFIGCMIQVL